MIDKIHTSGFVDIDEPLNLEPEEPVKYYAALYVNDDRPTVFALRKKREQAEQDKRQIYQQFMVPSRIAFVQFLEAGDGPSCPVNLEE